MAPTPKTTWEDLANLGWHKQEVYDTLNAQRDKTMDGFKDIALNEGFAIDYTWYSYNVLRGSPRTTGATTETSSKTETVWTYDNSQNLQAFTTSISESWTESTSASLSISLSASISLGTTVSILGVGGADFNITIGTEATSAVTKENSYSLTQSWDITIGAKETVKIERTKTTTTGKATYYQDYGLKDSSMIGTHGKTYKEHKYWGYKANEHLKTPQGTMELDGYSEKTNFVFKIIRTGGQKETSEASALSRPAFAIKLGKNQDENEIITFAEPGPM